MKEDYLIHNKVIHRKIHCGKPNKIEYIFSSERNQVHLQYGKCKCQTCVIGKLHGAIGRNDLSAVMSIVSKRPNIINIQLNSDEHYIVQTSFFKSIMSKKWDITRFLIHNGADFGIPAYYKNGETEGIPLFKAMVMPDIPVDILTTLFMNTDLKYNIVKPYPDDTCSFYVSNENMNIFHIIVKACFNKCPFLHYIIDLFNNIKLNKEICDINTQTENMLCPFLYAMTLNSPDYLIDFLREQGADIWVNIDQRKIHTRSPVYTKILNLRQKETNKTMSLFRNFGKTPNNKKIIWNNLPDEIWREILTFTL